MRTEITTPFEIVAACMHTVNLDYFHFRIFEDTKSTNKFISATPTPRLSIYNAVMFILVEVGTDNAEKTNNLGFIVMLAQLCIQKQNKKDNKGGRWKPLFA